MEEKDILAKLAEFETKIKSAASEDAKKEIERKKFIARQ